MNFNQILFITLVYAVPGTISYIGLRRMYRLDEEISPGLGDLAAIFLPGVNFVGALVFSIDFIEYLIAKMERQEPKESRSRTNSTTQRVLNRFFGIK